MKQRVLVLGATGPGSPWWSDRIARLIVAGRLGDLGPNGVGRCNLVHVNDVVSAILAALRRDAASGRAFNLSLSVPVTWNEYFARYAAALTTPERRISPLRLALELRVLGVPMKLREAAAARLGRGRWHPAPAIRSRFTKLCRHDIRLDVTRAEQILGLRWTPLAHGLAGTADWFLRGGRT